MKKSQWKHVLHIVKRKEFIAPVLFSDFHSLPWVLGDLELVRLVPGPREVLEQAEVQPEGRVSWGQECSEQTGRLH